MATKADYIVQKELTEFFIYTMQNATTYFVLCIVSRDCISQTTIKSCNSLKVNN